MKILLLVSSLFFSWVSYSFAEPEQPDHTPSTSDEANRQEIENYLIQLQRGHEIQPLKALEQEFSGFLIAGQKGTPKGAVFILPDIAQHGLWPYITAPLRESLPLDGWTTLSISMPSLPSSHISQDPTPEQEQEQNQQEQEQNQEEQEPITPEASETSNANETLDGASQYSKQVLARISAGFNFLSEKEQNLVFVAQGRSAHWAIQWLAENQTDESKKFKNMTLVLIDATSGLATAAEINQPLSQFDFPILDLITNFNQNPEQINIQRLKGMAQQQREHYQQVQITTLNLGNSNNNLVVRRVRGWLKTHASVAARDN